MFSGGRARAFILLFLFAVALFLRSFELGANGLSEDEARKILATQSYRHGDFTTNGEHPMLLKLLATGCLIFAEKWNHWFPTATISPEAALRFPASLAGSLGVFAVYLLGGELLGPGAALIAAALWAVDVNSIALSRIAKEESLTALFFVFGNFFLLRGKRLHFTNRPEATKSYMACGASFGALFASKYILPYPWVTLIYYNLFRFRKEPRWRLDRNTCLKLYGCLACVFILLNPVVLSPAVWHYLWKYVSYKLTVHHGYFMMGKIYLNEAQYTLWAVPFYFYPLYIYVKTPLLLLIAFGAGLIYALRNYKDDRLLFLGMYFVLWVFFLSLPGGKFARHAMTFLPAVTLLQALGVWLFYSAVRSFLEKRNFGPSVSKAVMISLLLITVGWEAFLSWQYHPNQSFYVSWQAGGLSRLGYYFPQDEFYDVGLREAIRYVCLNARRDNSVLGCTSAVFEYYQNVYDRPDLKFISMASPRITFDREHEYYILAQPEYRRYLENDYMLTFAYSQLKPVFVSKVLSHTSVEVYYLSPQPPYVKKPYWTARHWPGLLAPLAQGSR